MIICVTSQGNSPDAEIDPRFGRCQYLALGNSKGDDIIFIENPFKDGGGAGIQVGQLMAEKKVNIVVTGNVGPNAFQTLQAGGIKVMSGVSGSVKSAFEKVKQGNIGPESQGPTVDSHFGIK